jgi:hypothetical protein
VRSRAVIGPDTDGGFFYFAERSIASRRRGHTWNQHAWGWLSDQLG